MAADNQTVISKIQVPDGTVYDIKPSNNANVNINGVYFTEVTGTASALTGTLDASLTTYYNGLKVVIYNTLNTDIAKTATLSLNNLDPKSIKRYNNEGGIIHAGGTALLIYKDNVFYQDNYADEFFKAGEGSNSINRKNSATIVSGNDSINLTSNTNYIYGANSVAEGSDNYANSYNTHVEGEDRIAYTGYSHAEGWDNIAGVGSITNVGDSLTTWTVATNYANKVQKGYIVEALNTHKLAKVIDVLDSTTFITDVSLANTSGRVRPTYIHHGAAGMATHVEGIATYTTTYGEHAQGKYNYSHIDPSVTGIFFDNSISTIHSIGIGGDNDNRRNAVEVMHNGDMYLYGAGSYDGVNIENATTVQELLNNVNTGYESEELSPIAAMDIYASPEYPAIVCVNARDYHSDGYTHPDYPNSESPIAQSLAISPGINMLYDITYSTGWSSGAVQINSEWGFAMLIHDVSLGQRVPAKYLLKKGKYTLHPDITDTTLQGFYNGSINGNAFGDIEDASIFNNSVYRAFDSYFYTTVHDYVTQHPEEKEPITYVYGYNYYSHDDPRNPKVYAIYPFSVGLNDSHNIFSTFTYAVSGKAIMDASNYPIAIDVDFSDDTVYGYVGEGGTDTSNNINITSINGKNIVSAGELVPSMAQDAMLDNPVAGCGENYIAGEDIQPYAIVCLGQDGSVYNITASSSHNIEMTSLNMDWGLAVYKNIQTALAGTRIPQGTLLQQCTVPASSSSSAVSTFYVHYLGSGEDGALKMNGVLSSVKPTSGTYVYAGVLDGPKGLMHYDFSNHDFISVITEDGSTKIKRINGVDISGDGGGGGLETFTYDNPVAGDAPNPIAGVNIPANSFVVLGTNGSLYPITYSTPVDINMDWGVAYLTYAVQAKNQPIRGTLMQQCYAADASYSANINTSYNNTSDTYLACYLHCSDHTNMATVLSNSPELETTEIAKGLTHVVFVGYRGANDNLSIDFSNHDFFGYALDENDESILTSINGRDISAQESSSLDIQIRNIGPTANVGINTTETKILQIDVPSDGTWKMTAQLTFFNSSTRSIEIESFICSSTGSLSSGYGSSYVHTASRVTAVGGSSGGYSNMYLQCISNGQTNRHYYLVAKVTTPGVSSGIIQALKVTDSAQDAYNATHMEAIRLGDYAV